MNINLPDLRGVLLDIKLGALNDPEKVRVETHEMDRLITALRKGKR